MMNDYVRMCMTYVYLYSFCVSEVHQRWGLTQKFSAENHSSVFSAACVTNSEELHVLAALRCCKPTLTQKSSVFEKSLLRKCQLYRAATRREITRKAITSFSKIGLFWVLESKSSQTKDTICSVYKRRLNWEEERIWETSSVEIFLLKQTLTFIAEFQGHCDVIVPSSTYGYRVFCKLDKTKQLQSTFCALFLRYRNTTLRNC